jgi:hypothetical protein
MDRTIRVFLRNSGNWSKCEFEDLKDGDIFKIYDGEERYSNPETGDNVWIAVGEPYRNEDGIWTIKTLY